LWHHQAQGCGSWADKVSAIKYHDNNANGFC
jgi:hypothetical protein